MVLSGGAVLSLGAWITMMATFIGAYAQAWLVMKTAGFDSYILAGGFNYWNQAIMNPKAPVDEAPDDEIPRYRTQLAVKGYFGGDAAVVSSQEASPDKPKAKKIIRKLRKKKKRLKGC